MEVPKQAEPPEGNTQGRQWEEKYVPEMTNR
jgi:hypothetical protein